MVSFNAVNLKVALMEAKKPTTVDIRIEISSPPLHKPSQHHQFLATAKSQLFILRM